MGYISGKSPGVLLFFVLLMLGVSGSSHAAEQETVMPHYKAIVEKKEDPGLWAGCSLGCAMGWTMSASSRLVSGGGNTYSADRAGDAKPETCWAEGVKGSGKGQWIQLNLKDHPGRKNTETSLWGFNILNGYRKSSRLYKANNRVKQFRLEHNGKAFAFLDLADSPMPQTVRFSAISVKAGDRVRLVVTKIYRGTLYDDTCVSEVRPMGAH